MRKLRFVHQLLDSLAQGQGAPAPSGTAEAAAGAPSSAVPSSGSVPKKAGGRGRPGRPPRAATGEVPGAKEDPGPPVKVTVNGCMPLRGDFDVEFDDTAETLICDMEFLPVRLLPDLRLLRFFSRMPSAPVFPTVMSVALGLCPYACMLRLCP